MISQYSYQQQPLQAVSSATCKKSVSISDVLQDFRIPIKDTINSLLNTSPRKTSINILATSAVTSFA